MGALVVQSYTKEHTYTEQDKELLAYVGQHVGAALSRARAIEETRQRVAELATVNSVGQALAAQLELDALIELVGERVRETFDADIAYVALLDPTQRSGSSSPTTAKPASDGTSLRSSTGRG